MARDDLQKEPDETPKAHTPPRPFSVKELKESLALHQARRELGVSHAATSDEIRAALRERLALSRLHPDQGGDGKKAASLIAAKNLLIAHLRAHAVAS